MGLLLKQKTPFIRFWIGPPSQPAKPLADRLLRQPQLARNRTVAGSFCFQVQNRLVASTIFRILETSGRPSRSPHQGAYPSSMEALLVTAETPGRAAEWPGDFDLTRGFGFPQRDHRIRLGSPISNVV